MKNLILPLLLFLCFTEVHAQESFVNSGNLKLFAGASINSFGNFTNTATASFVNDGSFFVKGNF